MAPSPIPVGINFADSYVLALHVAPCVLALQVDIVLTPEHLRTRRPRACFRRGTIRIEDFRRISGMLRAQLRLATQAAKLIGDVLTSSRSRMAIGNLWPIGASSNSKAGGSR